MSNLQNKPQSATNAIRRRKYHNKRNLKNSLTHRVAVIACSCAVILGGTTIMVNSEPVRAYEENSAQQLQSSYKSIQQVSYLKFAANSLTRSLLGFNYNHYLLVDETDFEADITRELTPHEMTGEALLAELKEVDYTQLTETPLKEAISELEEVINSFRAEGLDTEEACLETYGKLMEELDAAKTVLNDGTYKYPYTDRDYALLAKAVMREQGDNVSEDDAQAAVAAVILNRKANNGINGTLNNPTILDILQEPGQYGKGYSWNVDTSNITDKVWENTRRALEHEFELPANVLFQAGFKQGSGVYVKYWNPAPYNSWTYFCYL